MIDFGYLPVRCYSGSISRGGKVSEQREDSSMSISFSQKCWDTEDLPVLLHLDEFPPAPHHMLFISRKKQ